MDQIHVKAPGNWINDPNGFIYYNGQYHLFYQNFPYGTWWGTMHWGHCVSEDLVQWRHQKVAVFPSKFDDRNGCFSGSAVESEGELYLFYTGIRYLQENPENIHICKGDQFVSAQMMLKSEDGIRFDNIHSKKTILPPLDDPAVGDRQHTRDPKVWKGKKGWYMVLGTTEAGKGKFLIYKSQDLENWELGGTFSKENGFGWMWECPDYFKIGEDQILIFSPMGFLENTEKETNQTICVFADFDEDRCSMEFPDAYQFLDYGFDLYASQSTEDPEGRRILTAWVRMPQPVDDSWWGIFCAPRIVEVSDGRIYFRMHPNVRNAYSKRIQSLKEAEGGCCRLELDLMEGEELILGGYRIFAENGCICTDRSPVFPSECNWHMEGKTPPRRDGNHLSVLVDPNLIEIYINDGEYVVTQAVYGLGRELQIPAGKTIQMYTFDKGYVV